MSGTYVVKTHKHVWTWPIATYLFLGGLGAGISIVCCVLDMAFGLAALLPWCLALAVVCLGAGSALLVFELGRPLQFWRVFSLQRAVLTFGAWMVLILIAIDAVYFSCLIEWFPWSGEASAGIRPVFSALAFIVGTGVMLYTGVELSSMKARVLWNTPALPVLFMLSGVLTGVAACLLVVGIANTGEVMANERLAAIAMLNVALVVFDALTLVAVISYILMMYTSVTRGSRKAARRWLKGSMALPFWAGLVFVGLVLPLLLCLFPASGALYLAAIFTVIGGLCLRFLVVYSDDRRELTGEAFYWDHLPKGDEDWLKTNWT